ncbi:MAG: hypothetical protein ACKPKO_23670, partial [Candidatus Fonsibacter sp.]
MDKLEAKLHAKKIPLMHTWRYQHHFPETRAHNHASGMIQVPTGYKLSIDFAQESLEAVQVIIDKLGNLHWWSTIATSSPGGALRCDTNG